MKVYLINQEGKVYEAIDLILGNEVEKFKAALLLAVESNSTMIREQIICPSDLQIMLLRAMQRSAAIQECTISAVMLNISCNIERVDIFDFITDVLDMGNSVVIATDAMSAIKLVRESKNI